MSGTGFPSGSGLDDPAAWAVPVQPGVPDTRQMPAEQRPRLLPEVLCRWGPGDLNGDPLPCDNELALRCMCDYGAAEFNKGRCDLVNFDCMPAEVDTIKAYMAAAHPRVHYSIGPARHAIWRATSEWKARNAAAMKEHP